METSTKRSRLKLFLKLQRLSLIESISHSKDIHEHMGETAIQPPTL